MIRICKSCQSPFRPHQKVPHQEYCSSLKCQKARRKKWQKNKLKNDEDYKQNQHEAQLAWRKRNPDYWRKYRQNHPEYVERNRRMQKKRNFKDRHGRRNPETESQMVAKMDVLIRKNRVMPGYYLLSPIIVGGIAKMDGLIVRIEVISDI